MTQRIRRSFLYTPADRPGMMEKAVGTNADGVIYDLEDAVPPENKTAARENVREKLPEIEAGDTEISVRINGLQTDRWLADVRAAIGGGVDTLHVPLIEQPWQIRTVVETARQLSDESPEIIILVETPDGLISGDEIAFACQSLPTVTGISFGMSDYAATIGGSQLSPRIREFLSHRTLEIATVGNLQPISSVYPDADDLEQVRSVAEDASELGFVGQTVIHPSQINVVNEVFTPDEETVQRARELVSAFEGSAKGSIVTGGVFMDEAHVKRYRRIVRRYEWIQGTEGDED